MTVFGDLLELQATTAPHAVAIEDGTSVLTFAELAQFVRAARIRDHHGTPVVVHAGTGVASCLDVVAALASDRPAIILPAGAPVVPTMTLHGGHDSVVVYTSGTEGTPKAVVHSRDRLAAGIAGTLVLHDAGTVDTRPPDEVLADAVGSFLGITFHTVMPPFTIAGITVLLRVLCTGATVRWCHPFDPEMMLAAGGSVPLSVYSFTPFTARATIRSLRSKPVKAHALYAGVGGAFSDVRLLQALEDLLGCPVVQGYGSTELGGAALLSRLDDPPDVRWGTVGSPLPGVTTRLRTVAAGDELLVASPSMMLGYGDGDPLETGAFIATGDLGARTSAGHVRLCGRRTAMLQRGGRRLDPARIESSLESHDGVERAAVIGLPNQRLPGDDTIVAFVVLRDEVPANDLRRLVAEVDRPATPRRIVPVAELPLAADGSVARQRLRQWAAALCLAGSNA